MRWGSTPHTKQWTWGRVKPVDFLNPVVGDEIDAKLPGKLRAEAAGILAWAVEGFRSWQSEGLGDPPDVQEAREKWRADCDPIKEFLEECCELDTANPELWCKNSDLWKRYDAWAKDNGEKYTVSRTAFGLQLDRRGITQDWRRVDGKPARVRLHIRVL